MTYSLMFSCNFNTRRVQMFSEVSDLNLAQLLETAKNLFTDLVGAENLSFKWCDEENDIVILSSNKELQAAINVMEKQGKLFKFEVEAASRSNFEVLPLVFHLRLHDCNLTYKRNNQDYNLTHKRNK